MLNVATHANRLLTGIWPILMDSANGYIANAKVTNDHSRIESLKQKLGAANLRLLRKA